VYNNILVILHERYYQALNPKQNFNLKKGLSVCQLVHTNKSSPNKARLDNDSSSDEKRTGVQLYKQTIHVFW